MHRNIQPGLVIKKALIQRKELNEPKLQSINKKTKIQRKVIQNNKGRKPSRFRCWTCGLYQGDADLCKSCKHDSFKNNNNNYQN